MSPNKAIVGTIAVSISFILELTLVPLLLPSIGNLLNLSIGQLAWVFNSYGLSVAVGVLVGGLLGDVFRIKSVFAAGVLFFAMGSCVVALADSYSLLIAGRILQGFGGGVFSPLIPVLLTAAAPDRPGKVLIIWGSMAGYVAAFAPLIYSYIIVGYGWNLAFFAMAALSIAAMIIVMKSDVASNTETATRSEYSSLLKSNAFWAMLVYVFCTYGAITYYLFKLPLRLAEQDIAVVTIGFVLSTMWLSFSILSTLLRNQVDAPRVRSIVLIAPLLIAGGFQVTQVCGDLVCLLLSAVLVGTGIACSNATSTQLILNLSPRGSRALSASMDITAARLGGVIAVSLFAQSTFGLAVVMVFALSIVAFVCAFAATRDKKALV